MSDVNKRLERKFKSVVLSVVHAVAQLTRVVVVKNTFIFFFKACHHLIYIFFQAVSLRQFVAPGFFLALVCGPFYFTNLTETSILFS